MSGKVVEELSMRVIDNGCGALGLEGIGDSFQHSKHRKAFFLSGVFPQKQ